MQNQQERETTNSTARTGRRRSIGELVVACLLLLWGIGTACLLSPMLLEIVHGHGDRYDRFFSFFVFLGLIQACCCVFGGIGTILPNRVLAKRSLEVVTVGWIGQAICNAFNEQGVDKWIIVGCLACASIGALFFLLSRWLGRQEETDFRT